MELLDYLVTSKTRKALLKLIWKEGVEASGRQLSEMADISYSAIHRELMEMKEAGLINSRTEGKSEIFSRNDDYLEKGDLVNLLGRITANKKLKKIDDNQVKFNLIRFGAPLPKNNINSEELSLEESLVRGCSYSRKDPTVSRCIPLVFYFNKNSIDWGKLNYWASKLKSKKEVGFYLDLTSEVSGEDFFKKQLTTYKDKRRTKGEFFFNNEGAGSISKKLAEINTPNVARRWGFLLNMKLDIYKSILDKNIKQGRLK